MQAAITNIKGKVLLAVLAVAMAMCATLADAKEARADAWGNHGGYNTATRPVEVQCGYANATIHFAPPQAWPARGYTYQQVAWRPLIYVYNFSQRKWELSKHGTWQIGWASGYSPSDGGYWTWGSTSVPRGFVYKVAAEIKWYNPNTRTWDGHVNDWYYTYWNSSTQFCDYR
jgi:hypothetical protein